VDLRLEVEDLLSEVGDLKSEVENAAEIPQDPLNLTPAHPRAPSTKDDATSCAFVSSHKIMCPPLPTANILNKNFCSL